MHMGVCTASPQRDRHVKRLTPGVACCLAGGLTAVRKGTLAPVQVTTEKRSGNKAGCISLSIWTEKCPACCLTGAIRPLAGRFSIELLLFISRHLSLGSRDGGTGSPVVGLHTAQIQQHVAPQLAVAPLGPLRRVHWTSNSESHFLYTQKVTRVVGVETFLLDAHELAADLQKRFAASATVTELPGDKNKNKNFEIVLQVRFSLRTQRHELPLCAAPVSAWALCSPLTTVALGCHVLAAPADTAHCHNDSCGSYHVELGDGLTLSFLVCRARWSQSWRRTWSRGTASLRSIFPSRRRPPKRAARSEAGKHYLLHRTADVMTAGW